MSAPHLRVWAVSDGRAGMEAQALGLAEAIGRLIPTEISVRRVRWRPAFDRLPSALKRPWMLDPASDRVSPSGGGSWPDVWIAAGRATLPLSIGVRTWSGGRTFVVQTQDPRWRRRDYDLIVAPRHDGVKGPNVLEIVGAPHRVSPAALTKASADDAFGLGSLPRPRVAVLIGGRSKAFDLPPDHARDLAERVATTIGQAGGSILATFSRRTPQAARAAMHEAWSDLPGQVWDGHGPNPLFAYLAMADHVLVTEDSANMALEAAATGQPVHILPMVARGTTSKFSHLHDELTALGATCPFADTLDRWTYPPLHETDRAARAVVEAVRRRPIAPEGV